jgi:putative transposase
VSREILPSVRERSHRLRKHAYIGEVAAAFTACIAGRAPLFRDAAIIDVFTDLLRMAGRRHAATILIYCFMPDHLHLVLRGTDASSDVWRAMVDFKQRSGYWLSQNKTGVRWQKDFFDRVIRKDDDLGSELRYIALNPVRGGLVADSLEYPFLGSDVLDLEDLFSAA